SLLGRMLQRDGDREASWWEFVGRYGPLIYQTAARQGLQEADVEDVTQVVLGKLYQNLASYDRSRGRFRDWLRQVARHAARDLVAGPGQARRATGQDAVLENQEAPRTSSSAWARSSTWSCWRRHGGG